MQYSNQRQKIVFFFRSAGWLKFFKARRPENAFLQNLDSSLRAYADCKCMLFGTNPSQLLITSFHTPSHLPLSRGLGTYPVSVSTIHSTISR